VRWLGRVRYRDAHAVQHALHDRSSDDHLLLLEHPHVYTLGVRADLSHVLVPPAEVGAELVRTDRGGDVTYHGPGQLVGYPILTLATPPARPDTPAHVRAVEQVVIDTLADVGLPGCGRLPDYPGVWVDPAGPNPRKIGAIGVRITKGRSMHGFALNVAPDMAMFGHIVPCGIADRPVTSLAAEGIDAPMHAVVDAVVRRAAQQWGRGRAVERQDAAWERGLDTSTALPLSVRKPEWLRVQANMGPEYRQLKKTMRTLDLVTVCEEAGCPNIFECWNDGTATFMINGERCTRACGFCLVDTRQPLPVDPDEPERVAEACARMGLDHAVITAVARDDMPDGGAAAFAATVHAIRARLPNATVELLIPDCKGKAEALETIFAARPDVLNHNLETVVRLQRTVRPSASYTRSLAVLGRAKDAGLVTKSGMILGMGETAEEVRGAMADLRDVGVDILTLGQYLRPTGDHLPVLRWWTPAELDALADHGRTLGFAHVEASPLTRSSHHAKQAVQAVQAVQLLPTRGGVA
jgi:lipoyl synthase